MAVPFPGPGQPGESSVPGVPAWNGVGVAFSDHEQARPAWVDADDFDGLGEDLWKERSARLAAEAEPGEEPEDMPGGDGWIEDSWDSPEAAVLGDWGGDAWFGLGGAGETLPPGIPLHVPVEQAVGGLAGMSEYGVKEVIAAARRLRCRAEWLEMRATTEFARRRWEADRTPVKGPDGRWVFRNSIAEHAADELAFLLSEDWRGAEADMELSLALRDRLPLMAAHLAAGRVDAHRCRIVHEETSVLCDADARQADEMVAPDAPELRYTLLRKRARKAAMTLDPESGRERREKAARKKARVEKFMEKSGNHFSS